LCLANSKRIKHGGIMEYKFVGYHDNWDGKQSDFRFVRIFFISESGLYRQDSENYIILRFVPIKNEYIPIERNIVCQVGDSTIYGFLHKGELFIGTKEEITPKLRELLSLDDSEFSPLEKWDIGNFFKDRELVIQVLTRWLNSEEGKKFPRLTLKNFIKPGDFQS
jgi:hypothetical protein